MFLSRKWKIKNKLESSRCALFHIIILIRLSYGTHTSKKYLSFSVNKGSMHWRKKHINRIDVCFDSRTTEPKTEVEVEKNFSQFQISHITTNVCLMICSVPEIHHFN